LTQAPQNLLCCNTRTNPLILTYADSNHLDHFYCHDFYPAIDHGEYTDGWTIAKYDFRESTYHVDLVLEIQAYSHWFQVVGTAQTSTAPCFDACYPYHSFLSQWSQPSSASILDVKLSLILALCMPSGGCQDCTNGMSGGCSGVGPYINFALIEIDYNQWPDNAGCGTNGDLRVSTLVNISLFPDWDATNGIQPCGSWGMKATPAMNFFVIVITLLSITCWPYGQSG